MQIVKHQNYYNGKMLAKLRSFFILRELHSSPNRIIKKIYKLKIKNCAKQISIGMKTYLDDFLKTQQKRGTNEGKKFCARLEQI